MNKLHFIGCISPDDLIKWIDKKYPELAGICYYDAEKRRLASRSNEFDFYYDPIHGVIDISHYIKDDIIFCQSPEKCDLSTVQIKPKPNNILK